MKEKNACWVLKQPELVPFLSFSFFLSFFLDEGFHSPFFPPAPFREVCGSGIKGEGFSVRTRLQRSELSFGPQEQARRGQRRERGVLVFTSSEAHFRDIVGHRKASQMNFWVFWCIEKLRLHYRAVF